VKIEIDAFCLRAAAVEGPCPAKDIPGLEPEQGATRDDQRDSGSSVWTGYGERCSHRILRDRAAQRAASPAGAHPTAALVGCRPGWVIVRRLLALSVIVGSADGEFARSATGGSLGPIVATLLLGFGRA
jgi:hypothetical protein